MRKYSNILIALIIILLFAGCSSQNVKQYPRAAFEAHFMSVGDADAILIFADGKTMLIDSGTEQERDKVRGYLSVFGVEKLDAVVATHPHEDHIGNMDNIVNRLQIGSFYMPTLSSTTKAFKDMLNALDKKSIEPKTLSAYGSYTLGNAEVSVIAPLKTDYEEMNDNSAVLKVKYKNKKMLFAADVQSVGEKNIVASKQDISADVLKVAHHGANTSSSSAFLKAVSPKTAVISCAKNSKNKFPSPYVVKRLEDIGAKVYTTADRGDIVVATDGENIEVYTEK